VGRDETLPAQANAIAEAAAKMGATAEFDPLLKQAATKVKQLDAFMNNFYKSNADKMGE
jgi:hypothetical protein